MMRKKCPLQFGMIEHFLSEEFDTIVLRVVGMPLIEPELLNRTDGKIWKDYWEEAGLVLGFDYIYGKKSSFYVDRGLDCWDIAKVERIDCDLSGLLKAYDKGARDYNREIVMPFEMERRNLLFECVLPK